MRGFTISRVSVWVTLVWLLCGRTVDCQTPFLEITGQGERFFENVCDGCVISKGFGFASHLTCECFVICELKTSFKLSSMVDPWVSHQRCCPCGQTFSMKLLTCVNYRDKRSDCINPPFNNPCILVDNGELIPRLNPNSFPFTALCSGFIECVQIGLLFSPNPGCCPPGTCFDLDTRDCNMGACNENTCSLLREDEKADCTCKEELLPVGECDYVADDNDVTLFMGRENMITFQCAAGTCWEQSVCACVRTNNTGYNQCLPMTVLEFDTDATARDGRGNTIWTTTSGDVDVNGGVAEFDGGQINIAGLANTYLSNDFILHIKFVLKDNDGSSSDETQCLFGDCLDIEDPPLDVDPNNLGLSIDRTTDATGTEINLRLTYQDTQFMSQGAPFMSTDSMETVNYEIPGVMALDTMYDFWLIYSGSEEKFAAGVFDMSDNVIGSLQGEVPNSYLLVPNQSGFLFGSCLGADDFEGDLDNIEMWRACKPYENSQFVTVDTLLEGAPSAE